MYFLVLQSLFQPVIDFHRRALCAISLNTFFKYCGKFIHRSCSHVDTPRLYFSGLWNNLKQFGGHRHAMMPWEPCMVHKVLHELMLIWNSRILLNRLSTNLDSAEALQTVVCELTNRLHAWNAYQPSKLSRIEYFNISRAMAFLLSPEVRPVFVQGLVNTFGDPPRIPSCVPVNSSFG